MISLEPPLQWKTPVDNFLLQQNMSFKNFPIGIFFWFAMMD